jgi:surfactin synthase thioesterase subunit
MFGHGLGAVLAYEVARIVEARTGRAPMHLFVSGCASPTVAVSGGSIARWLSPVRESSPTGGGATCGTPAAAAAIAAITSAASRVAKVSSYPDAVLVDVLSDCPRLPRQFRSNPLMLRAMISTVRADVTAEETYAWYPERGAPVSCPITVFAGVDDEEAEDDTLARWREVTSSTCSVQRLPGDHYYLDDPRGRELLTRSITDALGRHMTRHASWLTVPCDRVGAGVGAADAGRCRGAK